MKFRLPNNFTQTPAMMVRRCGYLQIHDRISDQTSYVYKLTKERYPRFHLYITENTEETIFDLHLDQAKTRYDNQKAHNADYETPEVKAELTRVYTTITRFQNK